MSNFILYKSVDIISYPCHKISLSLSVNAWFPQTLKSAWIWLLSGKVLDFSICLENWQFSLESAWKWLFMGLKNNSPRNLSRLCVFYVFCTLDFKELRGFNNFLINFPITTDPVSHVFHGEYCKYRETSNIRCTLVGNKIVDHSDVVGASPVGAAPTTSSFSTWHLASGDSAKTAAWQYENLSSVWDWCDLY